MTTTPTAESDRIARVAAAKAEHAAMAEWKRNGSQGEAPATPNLDAINTDAATGTRSTTTKERKPVTPKVEIHYFRNGKPMPASQDKLSSVAFQSTRGIRAGDPMGRLDPDVKRISVTDFTALLAKAGVAAPATTSWDLTLPNGTMVSARIAGDATPVPAPDLATARAARAAGAAKAAAKKAPARKAAAAKTSAKKAPAKKAAAKAEVTPRHKAGRPLKAVK